MSDWSFLPSSSSAAPGEPPPSCLDTSAASRRFDASGRFHLSPSTSAYPMAASTLFPRVSRSCSTRWRRRWAPPERQATTRRSMRSRPRALFTLALALLCVSARFQGASSQHLASEIWTQFTLGLLLLSTCDFLTKLWFKGFLKWHTNWQQKDQLSHTRNKRKVKKV